MQISSESGQIFRTSPSLVGSPPSGDSTEQDAVWDIFDDREFYVQLLKEVLSGNGGVLSQRDEERFRFRSARLPPAFPMQKNLERQGTTEGPTWF